MKRNRIALLLDERKMKPATLAKLSGVPQQTIYNIVKKESIDRIEIGTFIKIAHCFGMTAEELFSGEPPAPVLYDDPRQADLNALYERLDEPGRIAAVGAVEGIVSAQLREKSEGEAGEPWDKSRSRRTA